MDPEDQPAAPSAAKAAVFLGAIAAGIGLALWLVSCGGITCLQPLYHLKAIASPRPGPVGRCSASDLALIGAFNTCLAGDPGPEQPCRSTAPETLGVVKRLSDKDRQFILYVEFDGGFKGPGLYPLRAWPLPTLDAHDGASKVAVREARTGALWRSTGGSVIVGPSGRSGTINAALDPADNASTPTTRGVLIDGPWRC